MRESASVSISHNIIRRFRRRIYSWVASQLASLRVAKRRRERQCAQAHGYYRPLEGIVTISFYLEIE